MVTKEDMSVIPNLALAGNSPNISARFTKDAQAINEEKNIKNRHFTISISAVRTENSISTVLYFKEFLTCKIIIPYQNI